MFNLQELLVLHSLNLPVMEMSEQTAETRVPVKLCIFRTDENQGQDNECHTNVQTEFLECIQNIICPGQNATSSK